MKIRKVVQDHHFKNLQKPALSPHIHAKNQKIYIPFNNFP